MCNCGRRAASSAASGATTYVVTYPDGSTKSMKTEMAARLAASRVTGATWAKAAA